MTDGYRPLPQNVLDAIRRRNLVEAIKLLREQTGLGSKEAKDLVAAPDMSWRRLPVPVGEPS